MNKSTKLLLIVILVIAIGTVLYFFFSNKQNNDELKNIRNNWESYIHYTDINYKYSPLGGIEAFDIPVQNNSDFLIDEVKITVSYIKENGGTFKEEQITINNIPPHSIKSSRAPDSPRGTSIQTKITEVISRGLHLCYPGTNSDLLDPNYCK